MTVTKECDFCYELHWRIDRRPDLARAMLAKVTPQGVLRQLLWIVNYVGREREALSEVSELKEEQ